MKKQIEFQSVHKKHIMKYFKDLTKTDHMKSVIKLLLSQNQMCTCTRVTCKREMLLAFKKKLLINYLSWSLHIAPTRASSFGKKKERSKNFVKTNFEKNGYIKKMPLPMEWVICSVSISIFFAAGICASHWIYSLSRHKQEVWYQKRYGDIGLVLQIFLLLFAVVQQSLFLVSVSLAASEAKQPNMRRKEEMNILEIVESQMYYICTTVCYVLGLYRTWLGYFDICYAKYSFEANWKSIIDPVHYQVESTFFVLYHKTLGNGRWLRVRAFISICVLYVVRAMFPICIKSSGNIFFN
ncbi:hypothetical protein RFI_17188 [Reticulomyxa filosa]|uniref:Uncharacterized protein n=1 Tax=Reticulomyxa filosa TaxID=46433 RepID=X6N186_RETFI|nr:hypothetical protein RFI_17188 [Reticulomyxa filosa]|eukprot:ETO20030.1 hypothetical protein RFI_17188 [Reticulomyxa filosa]